MTGTRDCNGAHTHHVVIVTNGKKITKSGTINPG